MKVRICMIVIAIALTGVSWANCRVGLTEYIQTQQLSIRRAELERMLAETTAMLEAERQQRNYAVGPSSKKIMEQVDELGRQLDERVKANSTDQEP